MAVSISRYKVRLLARLAACALTCWLAAISTVWAQATRLEVIPLRYRTVEQVIPVIQPMLAKGGTVSGYQGQLVVRTTPENLGEIKRILASIDTAPRRLLISVRQDAYGEYGARQGGTVDLRSRVLDSGAAASDRDSQTVQVTEGNPAFIRVGQSVPVPQQWVEGAYVRGRVVEPVLGGTEYRDVTSGFYVLPRVSGDRVTLEISSQREALSGQVTGGVNVQGVATTVSGRLGEWIEVAGTSQTVGAERSIVLGRTSNTATNARRVLVRVEELK